LIDLMDDDAAAEAAGTTTTGTGGVTDDLAGLFGPSTTTNASPPAGLAQRPAQATKDDIMGIFSKAPVQGISQPRPMAMGTSSYSGYDPNAAMGGMRASPGPLLQGGGQIMLPGTPQSQIKPLGGSRTGTPSLAGSTSLMQPQQPQQQQAAQQPAAQQPAQQTNQKDPFADLAGLW
jgi:hypothetical protein